MVSLFRRIPNGKLHNHYGPSETHVISAHTLSGPPHWPLLVPIGKPISNAQLYVVDEAGRPTPPGVPGELLLGGSPLARGYLNRPEQTAKAFVENPFDSQRSPRVYRTGDLAKWMPDGVLRFLGRIDDQVKIRGFRVELGEVETALSKHPLIGEAVVTVDGATSGERRLVAHFVPVEGEKISTNDLRRFLSESLPEYMIPSIFAERQSWPLTPSGKIDRRNLDATRRRAPRPVGDLRRAAQRG
ncbi:MAG: AMP-binding protein [Bryobacterales bacterium]